MCSNFGLIYGAVDGTPMQAWSPPEALAKCNTTAAATAEANAARAMTAAPAATDNSSKGVVAAPAPPNNDDPSVLFNAIINPVVGYAIRGVLWYQGASRALDGGLKHALRLGCATCTSWWHPPPCCFCCCCR